MKGCTFLLHIDDSGVVVEIIVPDGGEVVDCIFLGGGNGRFYVHGSDKFISLGNPPHKYERNSRWAET